MISKSIKFNISSSYFESLKLILRDNPFKIRLPSNCGISTKHDDLAEYYSFTSFYYGSVALDIHGFYFRGNWQRRMETES